MAGCKTDFLCTLSEYKSVDCPRTYKNYVHTETQYPLVPEYTQAPVLGLNSSRGMFTLVPTMYCPQAQCPRMTKCELCLRNNIIIFTSSFSRYSKVSFNIIGTVQNKKKDLQYSATTTRGWKDWIELVNYYCQSWFSVIFIVIISFYIVIYLFYFIYIFVCSHAASICWKIWVVF